MFDALTKPREPFLVRVRQNLRDYREPLFGLLLVGLLTYWPLFAPILNQPKINGVWFRQSGDRTMPAEMKITARNGRFYETFPTERGDYATIELELDGRDHAWTGDALMYSAGSDYLKAYSATAQGDDLALTLFYVTPDSQLKPVVETWTVHGREMVVSRTAMMTRYQHASWFRSLFTEEP